MPNSSGRVIRPGRRLVVAAFLAVLLAGGWAFLMHGRSIWLPWVTSWDVLAASGTSGPKLREGDRQVPEGVYRIEGLNPNSAYHLSLKVDYPNAMDRAWAARDGRTRLGGDIFIHGKNVSIGCLAIGDAAVVELRAASPRRLSRTRSPASRDREKGACVSAATAK